jgi:uncharacterized protein YjaG (DUF416 family)
MPFMCEFCHAYLNGLVWQRITFNAYLLPEKLKDNFKSYFGCQRTTFSAYNPGMAGNGQLSALILTHSRTKTKEVTF